LERASVEARSHSGEETIAMEAELYCLTRDVAHAELVVQFLRSEIDESINLMVTDVEQGDPYAREPIAQRYAQLLQATVPPSRGLYVSVTAMDFVRDRIYLRIYWPVYVQGYWSEIAGTAVFFEGYSLQRGVSCYPQGGVTAETPEKRGLELFFPALALRGRMALVPHGQSTLLDLIGAPPIEMPDELPRDVIEVDFADETELRQAAVEVGRSLLAEVGQEVHSYIQQHPSRQVDFEQLANELKVTPALVKRVIDEDIVPIYARLSAELDEQRFIQGRWTKTGLTVRNDSDYVLDDVIVTVSGPAEVRPSLITMKLGPHSESVAEVSIQLRDLGDVPLEIALVLPDHRSLSEWLPNPAVVWVECVLE
jgi:hypothetical protein